MESENEQDGTERMEADDLAAGRMDSERMETRAEQLAERIEARAEALADVRSYAVQVDLLGTARRIYRARWLLLLTTAVGLAVALVMALRAKPFYIAHAMFLPPKNTDVLNPTPASLFGGTDSSDVYLGLLTSRTLQDDVIAHLGLMKEFHVDTHVDAEERLAAMSGFGVSKNTLIDVSVTSGDPKLAAAIANMYMEALYRLNGEMLASGSVHRRGFFEAQLEDQKRALEAAEADLRKTQERTGVVLPTGEAQSALAATASLQAQIDSARAQLAGLLTGATESNPQVIVARRTIAQLEAQLARQQAAGSGSGLTGNRQLPQLTLELAEKQREVTLRTGTYEALVQQYERARLSAIDPGAQLQIVDMATVPEKKAGPARKQYLIYGVLWGLMAGLAWLFGRDPAVRFYRKLKQPDPVR